MNCTCGSDTKVTDTRTHDSGGVWRRRKCKSCSSVFYTLEQQYSGQPKSPPAKVAPVKHTIRNTVDAVPPVPPAVRPPPVTPREIIPNARHRIEELRLQRAMEVLNSDDDYDY